MKKINIILLIIISFSFCAVSVAYERGILINSKSGGYYQELLELGPPGTFLMSNPKSPNGLSWEYIKIPKSPFIVTVVSSTNGSGTETISLTDGTVIASTTISKSLNVMVAN